MDILNGYRMKVLGKGERGWPCDACRSDDAAGVMPKRAHAILVNPNGRPVSHVLCAEHVVELATGHGCVTLELDGKVGKSALEIAVRSHNHALVCKHRIGGGS